MQAPRRFVASLIALMGVLIASAATAQVSLGPDAADHIMTDELDQNLFDYVDISATGQVLPTSEDDDGVVDFVFPTGKTFYFYGQERDGFRASTNGFLSTNGADVAAPINDCNFPTWPYGPFQGDGDRIYLLHDDLDNVTIYGQYFDENNPPAGWVGDVSVIQWQGTYFNNGAQNVDFEILFFHRLNVALIMYQTVDQTGSGSTTAIINQGGTTGLLYDCDFAGTVNPGLILALGTLKLNEIRTDQPGTDTDQYFELTGVPGFDLTGLSLIVIGDSGANEGIVEEVADLTGVSFDPDDTGSTLVSIGDDTAPTLTYDWYGPLDFENDDNLTFFLVDGFTGNNNDDLDIDDDGSLDSTPWSRIIDEVAILDNVATGDAIYSGVTVGPDPTLGAPYHVQRCADHTGSWVIADDGGDLAGLDTPTGLNACQQCGNGLVEGNEVCDGDGAGTGGETATCDDDCTAVVCGDGNQNVAAGEGCDDGDNDNTDACPDGVNGTCQPAACGDGHIQATVEGCDDGNQSNDDDCPDGTNGTCQVATCGDGFIDMEGASQEDCDGDGMGTSGETASCDADCTDVVCGDGTINSTAGETCEDGNQSNADDCPDDGANGGTCMAATCGDGFVDQQGGMMEECDGDGMGNAGETVDCDTDCTNAMCGDGVTNTAAGEDCDDTAESVSCDGDCTSVVCGDGELNTTAGEECDDSNTTPGDGCDANCMTEMGMGGMGGMGAGGMGTGGMGTGGMGTGGMGTGGAGTGGMGPGAGVGGSTSSGGDDDDDGVAAEEGGCDCSTPGNGSNRGAAPLALFLGLGLAVARRRRR